MEQLMKTLALSLIEWMKTDDFKQRLEKAIGMPYDEVIAKLKAKFKSPEELDLAIQSLFNEK